MNDDERQWINPEMSIEEFASLPYVGLRGKFMRTLVIHHASCWDGFCCAWLINSYFSDPDQISYHAAHYGTEPPNIPDSSAETIRLFIVDFSYPREVMKSLLSRQPFSTVILDHHQTAQEALAGLQEEFPQSTIMFDMNMSAGRLTWDWLYDKGYIPIMPDTMLPVFGEKITRDNPHWIVKYTEDRDLHGPADCRLLNSREINATLRSYPLDFATWDRLVDRNLLGEMVAEGRAILRREAQIIAEAVKNAYMITLDGHQVLTVNSTVLFSEIAGELANGNPFGSCYFLRDKGRIMQFSLRSQAHGLDVSEIAKKFGGGGHKHAAGFEVVLPPFLPGPESFHGNVAKVSGT
jgi:oligoribonuclease NrnB/cAMP/cGMP phosphodiesterase (DHH superfamily)